MSDLLTKNAVNFNRELLKNWSANASVDVFSVKKSCKNTHTLLPQGQIFL